MATEMEQIIGVLIANRDRYASDVLKGCRSGTGFDLGMHAGVVQGYERAINDILKLKEQREDNDDNL